MSKVIILNGPNLGRLGVREPEVYGALTLADLSVAASAWATELGLDLQGVRQTDDEGTLITWIHEAIDASWDIVLNPAAFTHYSYGLKDAAAQVTTGGLKLIEVHISNPYAREAFRHKSVIGPVASGTIAGFGFNSYRLALQALTF